MVAVVFVAETPDGGPLSTRLCQAAPVRGTVRAVATHVLKLAIEIVHLVDLAPLFTGQRRCIVRLEVSVRALVGTVVSRGPATYVARHFTQGAVEENSKE